MLYEPPKTKRYILIGVIAIVLAVFAVVAVPLLHNKITQTPQDNPISIKEKLQQEKIQNDMHEAAKRLEDQEIPEQKIQEEMKSASEELKKMPTPSPEDMQKAAQELNKLKK
jgi:predicted Holliday junction resolvase-like endonuclease